MVKIYTLWRRTYLYSLYKGVPPPPPPTGKWPPFPAILKIKKSASAAADQFSVFSPVELGHSYRVQLNYRPIQASFFGYERAEPV